MTRNRDFKTLVRQRMTKTGERYSTARAHVLAAKDGTATAFGLFASVSAVGGQQADLAAARNLCTSAGITGPDGNSMSEAMAFGLAGGVGFLYGVFEYGDTPTMTIVARNQSMPDPFCQQLFERLSLPIEVKTTSGAKKAAADLDAALEAQRPVLCTVGAGGLPYLGLPEDEAAMAPHLVGVVGVTDDGVLLLDDRSPNPLPVGRADFDNARGLYRQGKNRMVLMTDSADLAPDPNWTDLLATAVRESASGFDRPPVPQFKSNVGLAGLAKWQDLLTSSTKKGWTTIFGADRRAGIGLSRIYDCLNYAYTAPDAGRPLMAQFMTEAAEVAGRPEWSGAAELWAESGRAWRRISEIVLSAHPDIERYGQLSDERADALDSGLGLDGIDANAMAAYSAEQREILDAFSMSSDSAGKVYGDIAETVSTIVELETQALGAMV